MDVDKLRSLIVEWLESRREHIRGLALSIGVPETIPTEVRLIRLNRGGGAIGEAVIRFSSPLRNSQLAHTLGTAAKPLLNDESRRLGQLLLELAGARSHLLRMNLAASSPQSAVSGGAQLEGTEYDDIQITSDDPGRLLLTLLEAYLSALPSLGSGDVALAGELVEEFLRFIRSPTVTVTTAVPIGGLSLPNDELAEGGVRLRRLDAEELGIFSAEVWRFQAQDHRFPPWIQRPRYFLEAYALEIKEEVARADPLILSSWPRKVILAFQLDGFNLWGDWPAVSWPGPTWLRGSFAAGPVTIRPSPLPGQGLPQERAITPELLRDVVALARKIPDAAAQTYLQPTTPSEVALRRFALGVSRPVSSDALIDFAVTLESILLPGLRDELRYRFALHGAIFLAGSAAERLETYKALQHCYDTRSRLVHGTGGKKSSVPSEGELQEIARIARQLAARVVRRGLEEGWPTLDDLKQSALGGVESTPRSKQ
jgi:Apea-like HEPN